MTIRIAFPTIAACLLLSVPALAETFEVKMLNRGEKGTMVFEPDYLELEPGDRIRFIPTHKSHRRITAWAW